jgi:hypothetical protein
VFASAVVTAACGVIAMQAAPASAEPPLRTVGPASAGLRPGEGQVIADGTRVAYSLAPDRVRVIDVNLAELASVTEAGCGWQDFGGGALLWNCEPRPPTYPFGLSLIDELDGDPQTVLEPPLRLGFGGHGETPTWAGVGRRWLSVTWTGESHAYVNRATGKVVKDESVGTQTAGRLITDLDQADLTRRVCAPLAPKVVEGARGFNVVVPLAYRPPYGATRSRSRLLTGRCAAPRLTVLSRCPRSCSDPVVGDTFIAWTEGTSPTRRTLYVRLLNRSRTWRWSLRFPLQPSQRHLAAAGHRLFIFDDGTLKTLRLPAQAGTR